jgi:hypothetical protein
MRSGYGLVRCKEQKLERDRGERERERCCEVKQLLDMCGVSTDELLVCHLILSL